VLPAPAARRGFCLAIGDSDGIWQVSRSHMVHETLQLPKSHMVHGTLRVPTSHVVDETLLVPRSHIVRETLRSASRARY
jgi:hypothetical protein